MLTEAIKALLEDSEMREVLLDYLRAATTALEGERSLQADSWREVWRREETVNEETVVPGQRPSLFGAPTPITYTKATVLTLIGSHCESEQVGKVQATVQTTGLLSTASRIVYEEAFMADDYTETIVRSQAAWDKAVAAWQATASEKQVEA